MTNICLWIFKVTTIFSIGTLLYKKSDGSTRAPVPFKCTEKPSFATDGLMLLLSQTPATTLQPSLKSTASSTKTGGSLLYLSQTPARTYHPSPVASASSTKKGTVCPSHYDVSFNNSCYKFQHYHSFSRSAARSNCESEYAHLVYIESEEENELIVGDLLKERKYWIGLHSAERHLYWDNGDKVTFSKAYPDSYYTFNGGEGCYRFKVKDNLWLDGSCESEKEYICEYEDIQGDGCPFDYEKLFDDSCYKIIHDRTLNRSSAKSDCESDSAHLLFIESEQENNNLIESLESSIEYWIGLWSEPRRLYWDDDNEAVFTQLRPDLAIDTFNDGSGCYHVGIHDQRLWVDGPCNMTYGYICEYELNM